MIRKQEWNKDEIQNLLLHLLRLKKLHVTSTNGEEVAKGAGGSEVRKGRIAKESVRG